MELLGIALVTSFADSLNPIAIAQQFVLQGRVKKKSLILGFIIGIGLTNFLAGILVYYGIAAIFNKWLKILISSFPFILPVGQVLMGLGILTYLVFSKLHKSEMKTKESTEENQTQKLTFFSLFGLGMLSCIMELTSALPYFAFLSILAGKELSVFSVVAILFVYNLVYSLPLVFLYGCSVYFSEHLMLFYKKFNSWMIFIIEKVIPFILVLVSLFLLATGWKELSALFL